MPDKSARFSMVCGMTVLALTSGSARAEEGGESLAATAAEPSSPSVLEHLTAGSDLLRTAPTIALFDGSWSVVTELDTLLTSRRWDAPYPQGLLAQVATRVLYG
ncbi:MAG TPA: hypothetical protein VGQ57_14340, partial [Polyangiaceae bacterium]|nr:hypothetical protein [Polyangiaceae bacterium]